MKPRIAVMEFPGTNCERETFRAVQKAGMEPIRFRWNDDKELLRSCDGYVIGGGFSYEDRSRSGIIAAMDPVMDVLREQDKAGKPILGVCNGAQILLESGIVPGFANHRLGGALAQNKQMVDGKVVGTGFYNAWVNVRTVTQDNSDSFLGDLDPTTVYRIPAAHAEGRFVIPAQVLSMLRERNVAMLAYCDAQGTLNPRFPVNPNGSVDNLAGIGNFRGNAMAIMPHPERTGEGLRFFTSMRNYIERKRHRNIPVPQIPEGSGSEAKDVPYEPVGTARQLLVSTIITDNTAVSVEQALRSRGFPVTVKRAVHWELVPHEAVDPARFAQEFDIACKSGELLNPNKEFALRNLPDADGMILVRDPMEDDSTGLRTQQILESRLGLTSIRSVRHGVLWMLSVDGTYADQASKIVKEALDTHICDNPYSHRRFTYAKP